jgi:hypothetical protein
LRQHAFSAERLLAAAKRDCLNTRHGLLPGLLHGLLIGHLHRIPTNTALGHLLAAIILASVLFWDNGKVRSALPVFDPVAALIFVFKLPMVLFRAICGR